VPDEHTNGQIYLSILRTPPMGDVIKRNLTTFLYVPLQAVNETKWQQI